MALSDGSIVDEALLSPDLMLDNKEDEILFQQSLLNGLAGFVGNLPVQNQQKETVSIPITFQSIIHSISFEVKYKMQ